MANTFHCPSCLASLDHQHIESLAVKCPYCGTSVIVPDSLRQKSQDPQSSFDVYSDRSLGGLVEVAQLATSGRKIEAVKRYRELFDVSLKDAKDVVDQMQGGGVVQLGTSSERPVQTVKVDLGQPVRRLGRSCVTFLIILGVALSAFMFFGANFFQGERFSEVIAPLSQEIQEEISQAIPEEGAPVENLPADLILQFGDEGIGPGRFDDTRFVAVDGDGHIYTADYADGRIQRFDQDGNFLLTWNSGAEYTSGMTASRTGDLYVKDSPTTITVFDGATGDKIRTIEIPLYTDRFTLAADDTLVVYEGNPTDTLIFYDRDMNVRHTIPTFLGQVDDDLAFFGIDYLAVDGAGNIFAMTREEVLKFNSEGKFQGRPAVSADEPGAPSEPDLLFIAQAIDVDGRGRLYVADWSGIKIYDTNDRYLETIPLPEPSSIPFDLVVTEQDVIVVMDRNGNQVLKYKLKE